MKKFYAITLAAACTLGAAAATPQLSAESLKGLTPKSITTNKQKSDRPVMISSMQKVAELDGTPLKPLNNVDGKYTLEGIYTMTVGDYYFGNNSVGEVDITVTVTPDSEPGIYWMEEEAYEFFATEVPLLYDANSSLVTIPQVEIGLASTDPILYAMFCPTHYDWETDDIDFLSSVSFPFNETTGSIEFELDFGFGWPAFGDATLTQFAGWFGLFDTLAATQTGDLEMLDEEQAGQWKSVGNATFVDGWIIPSYQFNSGQKINPADYPYSVELQQNVNDEYLFRLWKPYQTEEHLITAEGLNQSKYDGQIIFDIEDPEMVIIFPYMPAGFKNKNGEFYMHNFAGLVTYMNFGKEYDKAMNPALKQTMIQNNWELNPMVENVITIGQPLFALDDPDDIDNIGIGWREPVPASITLPADLNSVHGVTTDNNFNAAVEYFNLQGVRVNRAEPGTLVIKKQGNNVEKVIVR